jgi:hypothetical protein
MRYITLTVLISLSLAAGAHGEAISVWNFNDAASGVSGGVREFLVDFGNGTMSSNFLFSNIANSPGSALNAQNGDPAGQALRLTGNANNDGNLTWMVSTENYESIDVSFAMQRTSTGFNANQFLYSTDSGVSWIPFGSPFTPSASFAVQSFDLSGIRELNGNPDVGFQIIFGGATSSMGNNKIDNLAVSGNPIAPATPIPEPSTITLTAMGLAGACLVFARRRWTTISGGIQ